MKVLVMGATGFLGTAVVEVLAERGHEVVAMVRSDSELASFDHARIADLGDPEAVAAAVTPDIDAVVHTSTPLGDWTVERRSIRAAQRELGSARKKFVYISGAWVLGSSVRDDGSSTPHDETSSWNPIALVAGREGAEADVLDGRATGIVIRPGVMHGRGSGIPALMTGWAARQGRGIFVGDDEDVTWACVHVDDVAELVVHALEAVETPQVLHAVAEPAVSVKEIAAAADVAVRGRGQATRWAVGDAAEELGSAFAEALALSQIVMSVATRSIGWEPSRPGIVDDVREHSYSEG